MRPQARPLTNQPTRPADRLRKLYSHTCQPARSNAGYLIRCERMGRNGKYYHCGADRPDYHRSDRRGRERVAQAERGPVMPDYDAYSSGYDAELRKTQTPDGSRKASKDTNAAPLPKNYGANTAKLTDADKAALNEAEQERREWEEKQ